MANMQGNQVVLQIENYLERIIKSKPEKLTANVAEFANKLFDHSDGWFDHLCNPESAAYFTKIKLPARVRLLSALLQPPSISVSS